MKKTALGLLVVCLGLVALEATSSYFLYRYYAHIAKAFEPRGSAALTLLRRAFDKASGIRHEVQLSVDHAPVFGISDTLGFTTLPGRYKIIERFDGKKHFFELGVPEVGRRSTSYIPVHGSRRLFILGDSSIFGWGLDDEQTMPWLLQSRLPDIEVVNLSLTSYSTVHALIQLQQLKPTITSEDVIVLSYHPLTNDFNVVAPGVLQQLTVGYESQLAQAGRLQDMHIPFGAIDANGDLTIARISLGCAARPQVAGCQHRPVSIEVAERVTELAFDQILAMHAGHVVVAFVSGTDSDPVIAHLRALRLPIADLRSVNGYPEKTDIIPTDFHSGAFWHRQIYARLLQLLEQEHLVH